MRRSLHLREPMAKRFAELPPPPPWHRDLTTVGVTGTNGKTSTTLMVGAGLSRLSTPVAQVTTLGAFLDRERHPVDDDYAGFVATMKAARDRGGRHAAIELTSEALALGFAAAWPCGVGVFTNLTRDHLDAHGSAEHYLASKAQLFVHLPPGGTAVLNASDPASELLAEVVPPHADVVRYAQGEDHDKVCAHRGRDVTVSWEGTAFTLESRGETLPVTLRAIGEVYVDNALAAVGALAALGLDVTTVKQVLEEAAAPPGRFEVVRRLPHVVVDFAHSPDALRRTLDTAKGLAAGRLTVVFGAGGDRDALKRPAMGEAATVADRVIVTNDNPRSESPKDIAAQILEGVDTQDADATVVLDRDEAVAQAVVEAAPGDVVVVAGMGRQDAARVAAAWDAAHGG